MKTFEHTPLIYIVEDNSLYAEYCREIAMQCWKCEVKIFATGEEMLTEINAAPDLFIIDYHLDSVDPQAMDGEQLLEEIRKCGILAPVIFQSYERDIHLAIDLVRKGAVDYVVKDDEYPSYMEKLLLQIIHLKELYEEIGIKRKKLKRETLRVSLVILSFIVSLGILISL